MGHDCAVMASRAKANNSSTRKRPLQRAHVPRDLPSVPLLLSETLNLSSYCSCLFVLYVGVMLLVIFAVNIIAALQAVQFQG